MVIKSEHTKPGNDNVKMIWIRNEKYPWTGCFTSNGVSDEEYEKASYKNEKGQ